MAASKLTLWWSRARVALTSVIVAAIAVTAMRTTSAPRQWDGGALVLFEDAIVPGVFALAFALALLRWGDRVRALLDKAPRWLVDVTLLAVSMYLTVRFTFKAFGGWPQIQDEISYDLLAKRIAHGTPVPSSHPLPEFFRMRFLVDDGRNYPLFQPGWPLLLAFFHKINAPALGPGFATAMLTVGTSRLAERCYGRLTSLLAAALVLSSGFINVVGSAYFAHSWAAALLVLGLERLLAALQEESPERARRAAIAAGLFGAWLVITRLPAALTFGVAALVAIVGFSFESFRPPRLRAHLRKPLVAFGLALMVGPLAQMGWNYATTRNALELPQDKYFNQTEPVPNCHRIGFGEGIGCPREHPHDARPQGYTLVRAAAVTEMRWAVFRTDAWGTAWPIALFALFFARRWRARDAVIATATLGPVAVYFGFYYHAIQHGARLWADLMGPLSVAIAAGCISAFDKDEQPHRLRAWISVPATVLAILVVHDELTRDLPERIGNLSRVRQAERVSRALDAGNVHQAVVYIENCIEPDRGDVVYGWPSVMNKLPLESNDRIYVRSFGMEHDRQLAAFFPGRRHVRADCNGRPDLGVEVTPRKDLIVTELEAKFPPDDREGCYAAIKPDPLASNRQVLEIRANEPSAWARFRQYIPEAASYQVRASTIRRHDGGRFAVVIDGEQLGQLDTRGDRALITTALKTVPLSAGVHTVEVRSLEGPGVFFVSLDRLELVRR